MLLSEAGHLDFNNPDLVRDVVRRICLATGISKIRELEDKHLSLEINVNEERIVIKEIIDGMRAFADVAQEIPLNLVTKGIERYVGNVPMDSVYFASTENICHDVEAFERELETSKTEKLFTMVTCNNGQFVTFLTWLHAIRKYRPEWRTESSIYVVFTLAQKEAADRKAGTYEKSPPQSKRGRKKKVDV